MNIKIEFNCDNAAFADYDSEVQRILIALALKLQAAHDASEEYECSVYDLNGENIGTATLTK